MEPPDVLSPIEPMPLVIVTTSLRSLRAMWSIKDSSTRKGPIVFTSRTRAQDFVVDMARALPGDAGDPRAIDKHVYGDAIELFGRLANALGIGHVHGNYGELAAASFCQPLQFVGRGRISAGREDLPTVRQILTCKLQAEPAIGARDQYYRHVTFSGSVSGRVCPLHGL